MDQTVFKYVSGCLKFTITTKMEMSLVQNAFDTQYH